MTVIDKTELETLRDKLTEARSEVYDLRGEVTALRAQLEGDLPKATGWLQWKVWRQRNALSRLQRRVVAQRAVLRRIDELGRGLSREEWIALRDEAKDHEIEAFVAEDWMPPKE